MRYNPLALNVAVNAVANKFQLNPEPGKHHPHPYRPRGWECASAVELVGCAEARSASWPRANAVPFVHRILRALRKWPSDKAQATVEPACAPHIIDETAPECGFANHIPHPTACRYNSAPTIKIPQYLATNRRISLPKKRRLCSKSRHIYRVHFKSPLVSEV
jgi:hypothetical protein